MWHNHPLGIKIQIKIKNSLVEVKGTAYWTITGQYLIWISGLKSRSRILFYIMHDELPHSESLFIFCVFQEEASFMKAAMDKVQSSYLRSLQEVGDLLKKRVETIKNLKIWTPSHTPNKDDYTHTIICQLTS